MFIGHLYVSQPSQFGGFLENDLGYYMWQWESEGLTCTWHIWQ